MKACRIIGLTIIFSICLSSNLWAWDLEVGARALIPRIGAGEQEYEDESGNKTTFKPEPESIVTGVSYHLGIRLGSYQIDFDASTFNYQSTLTADNDAVTEDTTIDAAIRERRLGVNYHLERELAGLFAGIGISDIEETLESDDRTWTFKTTSPYLKAGLDLILGNLILRYEQIYLSMGEHSVQINSGGIIFRF